jgi:hypothetical protein
LETQSIAAMKRFLFISFLIVASILRLQAQDANSGFKFDKSKLELGGTLGFSFGSSSATGESTGLNISPEIGYRFSKYFSAGAGLSYIYRSYSDYDFSENYAGLTFYGRFRPIKYIVLLAEPEFYRTWGKNFESRFVPTLLLGGGATMPIGHGGVSFTLSYDVLQNDYSPYYNRLVYTIGYTFSF